MECADSKLERLEKLINLIANSIADLKNALERIFNAPDQPLQVYACTTANMPPAAIYPNSILLNTTLNVLAYSNGSAWFRCDTGAAI